MVSSPRRDDDHPAPPARHREERRGRARLQAWVVAGVVLVFLTIVLVLLVARVLSSAPGPKTVTGRPRRHRSTRRRRRASARGVVGPWSGAALTEAAAVVAFQELHAELAVLGAPPELLDRIVDAAADEVRHAERCEAFARVAGERTVPLTDSLPTPPRACRSELTRLVRIAQVAVESLVDGSVNEGREAARLRILAESTPPPLGPLIAEIAADEARHADLADDIVAWARSVGGRPAAVALAVGDWRGGARGPARQGAESWACVWASRITSAGRWPSRRPRTTGSSTGGGSS